MPRRRRGAVSYNKSAPKRPQPNLPFKGSSKSARSEYAKALPKLPSQGWEATWENELAYQRFCIMAMWSRASVATTQASVKTEGSTGMTANTIKLAKELELAKGGLWSREL
jgi:hypothetical protein